MQELSSANGWPDNVVNTPVYDTHGFLWIPTLNGLYKYDGYKFTKFVHRQNDSESLSSNIIYALYADYDGSLWVGTYGFGLNHFDPSTGKCEIYRYSQFDSFSISSDRVFDIFRDSKKRLWVAAPGTGPGLNIFDDRTRKFSRLQYCNEFKPGTRAYENNNIISSIIETRTHKILFGSRDGIWAWDDSTKKFHVFRDTENSGRLSNNLFMSLKEDENGFVWGGTWGGGLKKINLETGAMHTFLWSGKPSKVTRNICTAVETFIPGELWIGCGDTTFGLFNINKEQFEFFHEGAFEFFNNDDHVVNLYADSLRNLWMQVGNKGFIKINYKAQPFAIVSLGKIDRSKDEPLVSTFLWDDSLLYIGAERGGAMMYCYHQSTQKVTSIKCVTSRREGDIIQIKKDAKGNIWGAGNGLYKLNTLTEVLSEIKSPYSFEASDLCVDCEDNLWMTSYNGLYFYNSKLNSWKHFSKANSPDSLPDNMLYSIHSDKKGRIWIGLNNDKGLSIFDPADGKFINYNNSQKYPVRTVTDIIKDREGRIWQAGFGGISIWDEDDISHPFKNISAEDGLYDERITMLAEDSSGHVWAISANAVNEIDKTTFRVKAYSVAYPFFPVSEFLAIAVSNKNEIWIGAENGLFSFTEESIHVNNTAPAICITSFKVFDNEMPLSAIEHHQEIQLKYDQNYFSFEFAALTIDYADKNQYAYKLEGFDKDWIFSGNRHYAAYTNLPGGHYIFCVKASNADGIWNEKGLQIPLYITKAWWQQWWFYPIIVAIVFALLIFFYRYRITQIVRMEKMRMQIANDLHDDIGATLTSISYSSELIKMNIANREKVMLLLEKIGNNSRSMITGMNDIVWFVNPRNDTTENLFQRMKLYSASLFPERGIACSFVIPEEERSLQLNMQQRKNIYLIFKEALHNAVKYSQCTSITIKIAFQERRVQIEIYDNGVGFELNGSRNGNGIYNMYSRAKEIDAVLNIISNPGNGTNISVAFKIP